MAGSAGDPAFTLKVGGTNYDYKANRVDFHHMSPGGKGDRGELTWTVRGGALAGTDPFLGKSIELWADEGAGAYILFKGRCLDLPISQGGFGWNRRYTARGLRDLADRVPVTNPADGTDRIVFNLRYDDREYDATFAGCSAGSIIRYTLESTCTRTALTALGIGNYNTNSLPTNTTDDLNTLTTILPRPVYVGGERVLQAVEGVLRDGAPNIVMRIAPNGTIQFKDVRNFNTSTATVIRLDSNTGDIVDLADMNLTRSVSDCYTRVRVRGTTKVVGAWLSTNKGTLVEDFGHDNMTTAQAKSAWRLYDFIRPGDPTGEASFIPTINGTGVITGVAVAATGWGYNANSNIALTFTSSVGSGAAGNFATDVNGGATSVTLSSGGTGYNTLTPPGITPPRKTLPGQVDTGNCSMSNTTSVTVTSSDTTRKWNSGFWDQTTNGRHGVIYLYAPIVSGVNAFFSAQITNTTQLNAGNTSVLLLDRPAPSNSFNTYIIYGTAGGASGVWRKYKPADANVATNLAMVFPFPTPAVSTDGASVELVSRPSMQVVCTTKDNQVNYTTTLPVPMTVDIKNGYFYAEKPVVTYFGTTANLKLGGANTDGIPDDVRVFAAVRTGNLEAIRPANDVNGNAVFSGTANSVEGIQETLTVTMRDWLDPGNQNTMENYAQDLLESVQDTVCEGVIPLVGYRSQYLTNFGISAQVWGPSGSYSVPWENHVTFPIVRTALEFSQVGPRYRTIIYISNRRSAFTEEIYRRIPPIQGPWWGADLTQAEFKVGDIGVMKSLTEERMPGVRWGNASVFKPGTSGENP